LRDVERHGRSVKGDRLTYQKARWSFSLWTRRVRRLLLLGSLLAVGFRFDVVFDFQLRFSLCGFGLGTTLGSWLAGTLGLVAGFTVLGGGLAASLWFLDFFAFLWRGLCLDWAGRGFSSLARSALGRPSSGSASGDAGDFKAVFLPEKTDAVGNRDGVFVFERLSNGGNVDLMR
jgi:hypothetical protein